MSSYDPRFWEVCVDPAILATLVEDTREVYTEQETQADQVRRMKHRRLVRQAIGQIRIIIETRLTEKQRQVVELHFFESKTQEEIAEILGIRQQVVSKHLFGAMRGGNRIGGALRRLRKICREQGIDPEKWV